MGNTFLANAGFSGAMGLAAKTGLLGSQAPSLLFPESDFYMCYSLPTVRCTNVWNTMASCCVGQKNLCSVMDVLLVVD